MNVPGINYLLNYWLIICELKLWKLSGTSQNNPAPILYFI